MSFIFLSALTCVALALQLTTVCSQETIDTKLLVTDPIESIFNRSQDLVLPKHHLTLSTNGSLPSNLAAAWIQVSFGSHEAYKLYRERRCAKWCEEPVGSLTFICCQEVPPDASQKPGFCPIFPINCEEQQIPREFTEEMCENEFFCRGHEKCCYNHCLQKNFCVKPIA